MPRQIPLNLRKAKKPVSYRLTLEVIEELEYLSEYYDMSQTAVVENLIRSDYNKLKGDPELQKAFEQLKKLREAFEGLANSNLVEK